MGVRPGEKIHEELISKGETFNIHSYKNFYILSSPENIKFLKKYKKLNKNFSYNSNETGFYNITQLRKIIKSELSKKR